jgi:hypothetical protein
MKRPGYAGHEKKERFARKKLPDLRQAFPVAQKVGKKLGRSEILQ